MAYYYITVRYLNRRPTPKSTIGGLRSAHIIKSNCDTEALQIRNKFGIAYPWDSKDIMRITCKRLDMRHRFNKELVARRKKGIGGSIWYENKKGKLCKEK